MARIGTLLSLTVANYVKFYPQRKLRPANFTRLFRKPLLFKTWTALLQVIIVRFVACGMQGMPTNATECPLFSNSVTKNTNVTAVKTSELGR
jgi:hypothetical protein